MQGKRESESPAPRSCTNAWLRQLRPDTMAFSEAEADLHQHLEHPWFAVQIHWLDQHLVATEPVAAQPDRCWR